MNEFGQPIGAALGGWIAPQMPSTAALIGHAVRLEPLDTAAHTDALFTALAPASPSLWTYMSIGPFGGRNELADALAAMCAHPDRRPYAIVVEGDALGFASFLRIDQRSGVLEIGSIVLSPSLQRTTPATEAFFLMIDHCFTLGYRRCEWKCDARNAASMSAAERLGFRYEGTFRQATHYKGRNRDTAWFAITDDDWCTLRFVFQRWLSPENFDDDGHPLKSLRTMTWPVSGRNTDPTHAKD